MKSEMEGDGVGRRRNAEDINLEAFHTDGFMRGISELLKLPSDVACGDTRISVIGKSKVKVENYRSILVYSDTRIKIQARAQIVIIDGTQLRIRYYDQDEMEVLGWISGVMFE